MKSLRRIQLEKRHTRACNNLHNHTRLCNLCQTGKVCGRKERLHLECNKLYKLLQDTGDRLYGK